MTTMWNKFEPSANQYPERIVEEKIEGFSQATNNLANLVIEAKSGLEAWSMTNDLDFLFVVTLNSPKIPYFGYEVFTFGYKPTLMPIFVKVESGIADELHMSHSYNEIRSEKQFKELLSKIFDTKKFKEVVGGVMKVAQKSIMNQS
jgi:hypothetical protein